MTFTHAGLSLHYRTFGHGPTPLLALHGFGRTGEDFRVFEAKLGDRFTLYALDLPFHGESDAPAPRATDPFAPEELGAYFTAFADHIGAERVVLCGYSLGGRLVLSLLTTMPERVARAVLIAPDGLTQRPWYRALAASEWGQRRYARFLERPGTVTALIHLAHRLRLIRMKMHRFLIGQIATRQQRQLVHDVWLSFRLIEPDLSEVAGRIAERKIPVHLLLGTYDQVIKPGSAEALRKKAPANIHVHLLQVGHTMLIPDTADFLHNLFM